MTARRKLTIAMPNELVIAVDDCRGDVPRSVFLQRAVEKYIQTANGGIRRRKR